MNEYSTDDAGASKFRPHGRVEFSIVEKDLLVYQAIGPFNIELMAAVEEIEVLLFEKLKRDTKHWVEVVVFKQSCMAVSEVTDELEKYLKQMKENNLSAQAYAYAIDNDVEGLNFMRDIFIQCFQQADLPFAIFDNEADAIRWVKSFLDNSS